METFFRYSVSDDPQKAQEIQDFDDYAIKKYSVYSNLLYKIAQDVNLNFQHADLFLLRDKVQENVIHLLERHKQFFDEQKSLAFEVVNHLEPQVIVIANAKASDLILESWPGISSFSDEVGHHSILLEKNVSIPIFFSSTVSGGRLDKYSRQRLTWYIKRSLR